MAAAEVEIASEAVFEPTKAPLLIDVGNVIAPLKVTSDVPKLIRPVLCTKVVMITELPSDKV